MLEPLVQPAPSRPAARRPAPLRVASLPPVGAMNPYQRLLYAHLSAEGIELAPDAELRIGWLWRNRGRVQLLHFHWPHHLYRFERGPAALRALLSPLKLCLFALRLAVARLLGYRVAWTIHQVYPHEQDGRRLDRLAGLLLARSCSVLLAHDAATREAAVRELGVARARIEIVPHGSYVGVYAPGRPRSVVRAELGIPPTAFVFLSFGELRANKNLENAVRAFRAVKAPDAALLIAGHPKNAAVAATLARLAEGDERITLDLRYVDDDRVAELFGACDAAVLPRDDGGTSGSLLLPLSLGVPVIAADRETYADALGGEAAGWLFRPGDVDSLRRALERAASDPRRARAKGGRAVELAARRSWPEIAARTAAALRETPEAGA